MIADDMTIRVTVVPTTEKDCTLYPWKAKTKVFNDIEGLGNTIQEALIELTEEIRMLYLDGALQLTNPNLDVEYKITQASAIIGLGVNRNRSLSEFTAQTNEETGTLNEFKKKVKEELEKEDGVTVEFHDAAGQADAEPDEELSCSNCMQKQTGECKGKKNNKICTHYAAEDEEP